MSLIVTRPNQTEKTDLYTPITRVIKGDSVVDAKSPSTTDAMMRMLTEQWSRANAAEERLARVEAAYAALKGKHATLQQSVRQKQVTSMREAIERVTTRKKPARVVRMTQEVQQALYDSIVRGNSIGEACREVGVSKTTYAWWRNRGQHANCNPIYHNFRSMMQKAIEERDRQARNVRSVTPSP